MNQDRFVMSDTVWKTYPIKPVMRMSPYGTFQPVSDPPIYGCCQG